MLVARDLANMVLREKTETEHLIEGTDLWMNHLISRAAVSSPHSPRTFFQDLEPIVEAHCIVIAGGVPLERELNAKDERRKIHAKQMHRNNGRVLLEDCTMTINERFRYLQNLKGIFETGGDVAVYFAMQCHQPIEFCLLEFNEPQFRKWWYSMRNTIPGQVKLNARDRAQKFGIQKLLSEAIPRPPKRRCKTPEFCQKVSRNVVHFKGIGSQITNDALADGHTRLLNDVLGRNNRHFHDCFVFVAMLKHIFETGGERALLACVLSVAPQDLFDLEYRRQDFERCWEVIDKPFDRWQRLDEFVETSPKVKTLRLKLLNLIQRYPEIPYQPSIKQRIKAGKFRTIG